MIHYLIGPYTSTTLDEHKRNIGKLYVYYLKLTKTQPGDPILCYPLMTSGFELVGNLHNHDWIGLCKALIAWTMPTCWVIPGYKGSSGSLKEISYAKQLQLTLCYFEAIGFDEKQRMIEDLMLLQNRNRFALWGLEWIVNN